MRPLLGEASTRGTRCLECGPAFAYGGSSLLLIPGPSFTLDREFDKVRPNLWRDRHSRERRDSGNLQPYLRIKEAAEFVGVSQGTLRTWGRDGKIATLRNPFNGYRLYRRADLAALLRGIGRSARNVGSHHGAR